MLQQPFLFRFLHSAYYSIFWLQDLFFQIVADIEDSDVMVINTCGFIESAKTEAIETILEVAEYKKAQYEHLLSQPSESFKYAQCEGVETSLSSSRGK